MLVLTMLLKMRTDPKKSPPNLGVRLRLMNEDAKWIYDFINKPNYLLL